MRCKVASRVLACLALLAGFGGCTSSGAVQAALQGDLKTLQAEIASAKALGDLDRSNVEELAQAVAGREIRSAAGDAAVRRLRTVRSCASPLYPVLKDRASQPDDAGAEAALILLEFNQLSPDRAVHEYVQSSNGPWRAVAARATVDPKYAPLRRKFFEDPDERVRRAALQAALEAKDRADLESLLEASRLDPDVLSRSFATRAVGSIGSEQAVLRLKDRWARASETVREEIIEAWAMPNAFHHGGERELVRIAETETGSVAIAAAHALYRNSDASRELGAQVLARAISEGTRYERRLALQLASFADDDLGKAITKASHDSDVFVRVMALAKLLSVPKEKAHAQRELQKIARKPGNEAVQARAALAAAGDTSIIGELNQQLGDKSAEKRKLAARALLRLGQYPDVATALGDGNPDVRTTVACNVLASRG